jgi:hypothetical protein
MQGVSLKEKNIPYPLSDTYLRKRASFCIFKPFDLADEFGRPLIESRSIQFEISAEDFKHCPFSDSRAGQSKLMNMAAFVRFRTEEQEVYKIWSDIAQVISSKEACKAIGVSLEVLWKIAYGVRIIPFAEIWTSYLQKKPYSPLAPVTATASKFSQGVSDVIINAIKRGHSADECWDADKYYVFADRYARLIGRLDVCPAAPRVIVDAFQRLLSLGPRGPFNHVPKIEFEQYTRVVDLSELHWILHRLAYIFEILRFAVWQRCNEKNLKLSAAYKNRSSNPYGVIAQSFKPTGNPLREPETSAYRADTWNLPSDSSPAAQLKAFDRIAERVGNALEEDGHAMLKNAWISLESAALRVLQATENSILMALRLTDWTPHTYTLKDLDHFFGAPHPVFDLR